MPGDAGPACDAGAAGDASSNEETEAGESDGVATSNSDATYRDAIASGDDAMSRDATARDGSPDGGPTVVSTADCFNSFGQDLVLTQTWAEYRIPFAATRQQPGFGRQVPAITRGQLYGVSFAIRPGVVFDLWIDDIAWYRAGE